MTKQMEVISDIMSNGQVSYVCYHNKQKKGVAFIRRYGGTAVISYIACYPRRQGTGSYIINYLKDRYVNIVGIIADLGDGNPIGFYEKVSNEIKGGLFKIKGNL